MKIKFREAFSVKHPKTLTAGAAVPLFSEQIIPDFDLILPLGCFGFRYLSKQDRKGFKLSPKNQAGVFLGFATLEKGTYGSILMIGERRFVVAQETVDFIHNNFPLKYAPSANPEYA